MEPDKEWGYRTFQSSSGASYLGTTHSVLHSQIDSHEKIIQIGD